MRLVDTFRRVSTDFAAHPRVRGTVALCGAFISRILANRRRRVVAVSGAMLLHLLFLLFILRRLPKACRPVAVAVPAMPATERG